MLNKLFSSKTRVEILGRVLLHPDKPIHSRELARQLGPGSYSAVWKELKNLENLGILSSNQIGRTVQYRLNKDSRLVPELTDLFVKNWLGTDVLAKILKKVGNIKIAFVYGSFASGKIGPQSDIDLIIIGAPDSDSLDTKLADVEERIGRDINYRLFTHQQWTKALDSKEPFIKEVLGSPKVFIIGSDDELEKVA